MRLAIFTTDVATDDELDDEFDDDGDKDKVKVTAPGAEHSLAMHLRRTVTQDAADAVALTAPRFKPVTGGGDSPGGDSPGAGRWEADKTALEDARDAVAPVINAYWEKA